MYLVLTKKNNVLFFVLFDTSTCTGRSGQPMGTRVHPAFLRLALLDFDRILGSALPQLIGFHRIMSTRALALPTKKKEDNKEMPGLIFAEFESP